MTELFVDDFQNLRFRAFVCVLSIFRLRAFDVLFACFQCFVCVLSVVRFRFRVFGYSFSVIHTLGDELFD